jgi:hypothetical protein
MMSKPEWTEDQLRAWIEHQGADDPAWTARALELAERWLSRGDGVAIYENHDMGHRDLGLGRMLSYGSPAAQIEADYPSDRMPDLGHEINWRYVLIATCKRVPAETVPVDVDITPAEPGPAWVWPEEAS